MKIEKHPRFFIRRGYGTIKFDIAILELEEPVDFVKYPHIRCSVVCFTKNSSNQFMFRPACLPDEDDLTLDFSNRTGTLVGWGAQTVTYRDTKCDYTRGIPDYSLSTKQKKIDLK